MLWTVFFILVVLWLVGVRSSHTMGGMIHVLLLFATVAGVIRIIQGRRPV